MNGSRPGLLPVSVHLLLVSVVLLALAPGCKDSGKPSPVADVGSAISDLAVTSRTDTTATLAWTAPRWDGTTGSSIHYDIRMVRGSGPEWWWDLAPLAPVMRPGSPGALESHTISGLSPDSVYRVTIMVCDEEGGCSSLSNVARIGDLVPPPPIDDLSVRIIDGENPVMLQFSPQRDLGDDAPPSAFQIRRSASPITPASWAAAPLVPFNGWEEGPPHYTSYWWIYTSLPPGSWYLAMRSVDRSGNWSDLSNTVEVTVPAARAERQTRGKR